MGQLLDNKRAPYAYVVICGMENESKECAGLSVHGSPYTKEEKGARRMPGLWKATKDAASCEKPGRGAGDL